MLFNQVVTTSIILSSDQKANLCVRFEPLITSFKDNARFVKNELKFYFFYQQTHIQNLRSVELLV